MVHLNSSERLLGYGLVLNAVFLLLVRLTTSNSSASKISHFERIKSVIEISASEQIVESMREALLTEVEESSGIIDFKMHVKSNILCLEASLPNAPDTRAWLASYLRLLKVSYEVAGLASKKITRKS